MEHILVSFSFKVSQITWWKKLFWWLAWFEMASHCSSLFSIFLFGPHIPKHITCKTLIGLPFTKRLSWQLTHDPLMSLSSLPRCSSRRKQHIAVCVCVLSVLHLCPPKPQYLATDSKSRVCVACNLLSNSTSLVAFLVLSHSIDWRKPGWCPVILVNCDRMNVLCSCKQRIDIWGKKINVPIYTVQALPNSGIWDNISFRLWGATKTAGLCSCSTAAHEAFFLGQGSIQEQHFDKNSRVSD